MSGCLSTRNYDNVKIRFCWAILENILESISTNTFVHSLQHTALPQLSTEHTQATTLGTKWGHPGMTSKGDAGETSLWSHQFV